MGLGCLAAAQGYTRCNIPSGAGHLPVQSPHEPTVLDDRGEGVFQTMLGEDLQAPSGHRRHRSSLCSAEHNCQPPRWQSHGQMQQAGTDT